MSRSRSSRRVREPVQAYLDEVDRALLEQVAHRTGLSRAEILRRGLRAFAWSFESLIGVLGDDPSIPTDLSERHDEYLAQALEDEINRSR